MSGTLLTIYGLDLLIVLLAIGAALAAQRERSGLPMPRWHLLLPGLLAYAGTVVLLAYPDIRDLADPQVLLVAAAGAGIGALRGGFLRLDSDQSHGLVRVRRGGDAAWLAWLMVLSATIQGVIETGLGAENPFEPTAEFFMVLASAYLLGRSLVAWLRARAAHHHDLLEV